MPQVLTIKNWLHFLIIIGRSVWKLFPLEATALGDNRYNDRLPIDFTDSYRDSLQNFFSKYKTFLTKYDREALNENDRISYDIFKREMDMSLEGLTFHDNYAVPTSFIALR